MSLESLTAELDRLVKLVETTKTVVVSHATTSTAVTNATETITQKFHDKLTELETFLEDYKPVVTSNTASLVSRLETDVRNVVNTIETDVSKVVAFPEAIVADVKSEFTAVKAVANTVEATVKVVTPVVVAVNAAASATSTPVSL